MKNKKIMFNSKEMIDFVKKVMNQNPRFYFSRAREFWVTNKFHCGFDDLVWKLHSRGYTSDNITVQSYAAYHQTYSSDPPETVERIKNIIEVQIEMIQASEQFAKNFIYLPGFSKLVPIEQPSYILEAGFPLPKSMYLSYKGSVKFESVLSAAENEDSFLAFRRDGNDIRAAAEKLGFTIKSKLTKDGIQTRYWVIK